MSKKTRHKDEIKRCRGCLEALERVPENSVDLLCTQPPNDFGVTGEESDEKTDLTPVWQKVLAVMKPGAFAFIMARPPQDRIARRIGELARTGFKIDFSPIFLTNPKPAPELILVAMKPLSEKSYEAQAKKNGKGVTWLDDCPDSICYRQTCTGWKSKNRQLRRVRDTERRKWLPRMVSKCRWSFPSQFARIWQYSRRLFSLFFLGCLGGAPPSLSCRSETLKKGREYGT